MGEPLEEADGGVNCGLGLDLGLDGSGLDCTTGPDSPAFGERIEVANGGSGLDCSAGPDLLAFGE